MTESKSELSIHAAVMNCVARCVESETPYICLGDFLEQLIEIGWVHNDVQAVRAAVLPMLGELQSGDTVRLGTAKVTASGPSSESKGAGKALERK